MADLVAQGIVPAAGAAELETVTETFRLRITPEMQTALHSAGVARQFLPRAEELTLRPEELADPIGDTAFSPAPGLTHRYPDRVILAVTQTCEVYCRFCFRRETVGRPGRCPRGSDAGAGLHRPHPRDPRGDSDRGDPLSLSPRRLGAVIDRLQAIPHLLQVRLHSRVPVVAPDRMDDAMLAVLDRDLPVHLVIHTNHPDELTPAARAALRRLNRAGIAMFSQSVLLRGVNDDADTLEALFRQLLANRVKPYYLHHCDLAKGTSHFRTTIAEGRALMAELRRRLSGLALPTYVLDIPGGAGKVPLTLPMPRPRAMPGPSPTALARSTAITIRSAARPPVFFAAPFSFLICPV
ncbi:KamA family radical SAM protein [Gemmobacter lanyuensis]